MLLALFEYYVFCFTTDDEQTTQNNITYKNEQMLFLYKWMMENMIQITHKKNITHALKIKKHKLEFTKNEKQQMSFLLNSKSKKRDGTLYK